MRTKYFTTVPAITCKVTLFYYVISYNYILDNFAQGSCLVIASAVVYEESNSP